MRYRQSQTISTINTYKYIKLHSDDQIQLIEKQLLVLGWVLKNNERKSHIICIKFRCSHRSHTSCNVATSTSTSTSSTTAGNRANKICSRNTDLNTTGIIASTDRCNAKVAKISDLHNQVILPDEEF